MSVTQRLNINAFPKTADLIDAIKERFKETSVVILTEGGNGLYAVERANDSWKLQEGITVVKG